MHPIVNNFEQNLLLLIISFFEKLYRDCYLLVGKLHFLQNSFTSSERKPLDIVVGIQIAK